MKVVSMRQTTLFVVTLCFVLEVNKGDFELTILHTNDVHARFEEFSEVSELPLCNKSADLCGIYYTRLVKSCGLKRECLKIFVKTFKASLYS